MLKNYFIIAIRNLWRTRGFSIINITGLAIGMAACFLIFLYVHFELNYDQFNTKANRIYRIVTDVSSPVETLHWHETPAPLAKAIKAEFPEVKETTRLFPGSLLIRKGEFKFQEEHSLWADPSIFKVFDFPFKYGNPQTDCVFRLVLSGWKYTQGCCHICQQQTQRPKAHQRPALSMHFLQIFHCRPSAG